MAGFTAEKKIKKIEITHRLKIVNQIFCQVNYFSIIAAYKDYKKKE